MHQQNELNRRKFFKNAALAALGVSGIAGLVAAANDHDPSPSLPDKSKNVILFQGDSITDAGRRRERYYPNDGSGMGNGYVYQIVSQLLGQYPGKEFHCYNRGISGNKVFQLANRWDDDCLQLSPDVLSILIGVNDFWHTLSGNYKGTVETYESDFRKLLDRTKSALPEVKLIIGEPFAVKGGSAINEKWYPTIHHYREAAQRVAKEYGATFVPYHSIFEKALETAPVSYWCPDGVHPSIAGGYLMAQAWLEAFKS